MKKRVSNVQTLDDLDGSPNASSVSFYMPDGRRVTVDLSPSHMASFRQTLGGIERKLEKYATAGTIEDAIPRPRRLGKQAHAQRIRKWAMDNGIDVRDRGRIPIEVVDAFNEANEL